MSAEAENLVLNNGDGREGSDSLTLDFAFPVVEGRLLRQPPPPLSN